MGTTGRRPRKPADALACGRVWNQRRLRGSEKQPEEESVQGGDHPGANGCPRRLPRAESVEVGGDARISLGRRPRRPWEVRAGGRMQSHGGRNEVRQQHGIRTACCRACMSRQWESKDEGHGRGRIKLMFVIQTKNSKDLSLLILYPNKIPVNTLFIK